MKEISSKIYIEMRLQWKDSYHDIDVCIDSNRLTNERGEIINEQSYICSYVFDGRGNNKVIYLSTMCRYAR